MNCSRICCAILFEYRSDIRGAGKAELLYLFNRGHRQTMATIIPPIKQIFSPITSSPCRQQAVQVLGRAFRPERERVGLVEQPVVEVFLFYPQLVAR
jgi:hypothetical protein